MIKYFLLFVLIHQDIFGQANFNGVYQGIFIGKKIIGLIKQRDSFVFGSLYEGQHTLHALTGIVEKDSLKGVIQFKPYANIDYEGQLIGDTLTLSLYLNKDSINKTISISLNKISDNDDIDISKFFERGVKKRDSLLVGQWQSVQIREIDGKIREKHDKYKLSFYANGNIMISGNAYSTIDINKGLKKMRMNWFVKEQEIFWDYDRAANQTSVGKYSINENRLIIINHLGYIEEFIKLK